MIALKRSLQKAEKYLAAALAEIRKMADSVDTLEAAVVGGQAKAKPKRKAKAKKASKAARKGGVSEQVLSAIQSSRKPVSKAKIKEETGLGDKQIQAALNRAKKEGKIKSVKRGVYGKA